MGRPRKPAHLRLVEGDTRNQGSRKHAERIAAEPLPPMPLGEPPQDMDAVEKEVWNRIGRELPPGMLRSVDLDIVWAFCTGVRIWRDARKKLFASSMVVKTPNGQVMQSPYLSIVNRQAVLIKQLGAELGLSPAARTRVSAEGGEGAEDPTDRFFG